MRHLFGTGKPAGIKTTLKEPAGAYLLDVVTGIRSGVTFTVQWTTAAAPKFEDARTLAPLAPRRNRRQHGHSDRDLRRRRTDRRSDLRRRRSGSPARSTPFACSPPTAPACRRRQTEKNKGHVQPGWLPSSDGDRRQHHGASRQRLGHRPANRPRPVGRLLVGKADRRCEGSADRGDDLPESRRRPALARQVPHLGHEWTATGFRPVRRCCSIILAKAKDKRTDADRQVLLGVLRRQDKAFPKLQADSDGRPTTGRRRYVT